MSSEHDETWLSFEGSLVDQIASPREPWDLRRPTARLVRELFDLNQFLPERKLLHEPSDEAQSYIVEKLKETGTVVDQLVNEARARAQLNDESIREIDYQIAKAASSLEIFSTWGIGYNTGVDIKRNVLERELSNLRKDRRSALLRTWEDIASLRRDFREALAEYKSLLGRLGLL